MSQSMAMISATHAVLLAVVVLLLFGAQKIPQLMRSIGSGMNEFKKGLREGQEALLSQAPPVEQKPPVETSSKSE